jgi:hypothetical protein
VCPHPGRGKGFRFAGLRGLTHSPRHREDGRRQALPIGDVVEPAVDARRTRDHSAVAVEDQQAGCLRMVGLARLADQQRTPGAVTVAGPTGNARFGALKLGPWSHVTGDGRPS